MNLISGKWVAQAVYVAAKLGIADMLKDGPLPCEELARANQVDALALYRVLRALASLGVFTEVSERQFGLTPMAQFLRSDQPGTLRPMATFFGEDYAWRPWGTLLASVKTGEAAFDRMYGMGLFEFFRTNREAGALFHKAMSGFSEQAARAVAAAYDFSGIEVLVDVGGGEGALLSGILKANPRMRGILFDRPDALAEAGARIEAEGLTARCEMVAGDFFQSVPPGGQAYILRHIIHDWDDKRAIAILANCHKAMGPRGRLLLVEDVIPPGDAPFFGKLLDLEMLVMATGRERTEAEYRTLLAGAGFALKRVVPTETPNSVIEGVPRV